MVGVTRQDVRCAKISRFYCDPERPKISLFHHVHGDRMIVGDPPRQGEMRMRFAIKNDVGQALLLDQRREPALPAGRGAEVEASIVEAPIIKIAAAQYGAAAARVVEP